MATTQAAEELRTLGVSEDAIDGILAVVAVRDVGELQQMLGDDTEVFFLTLRLAIVNAAPQASGGLRTKPMRC